jgi:signal peptidase I
MGTLFARSLALALAGLATAVLMRGSLRVVTVHGVGMRPTLDDGDRVLVARIRPRRMIPTGSLVLATVPLGADGGRDGTLQVIKRLVGRPGDTVVVDLRTLGPDLAARVAQTNGAMDQRWTVGERECLLRGDNPSSADAALLGALPLHTVDGVVVARLGRGVAAL